MPPDARAVALEALLRVEDGAFANLVLPTLLERSSLSQRDRDFVTGLVYGTTRMRRACDWLVGRFLRQPLEGLEPPVRNALRLGAYQLAFLGTPAHAAVGATVSTVAPRARGIVNAVLRRVAGDVSPSWPDAATRLSYPDWVLRRLVADLGEADALAALEAMDQPADVARRADGYVQDRASQWVADAVVAQPGERVADLCAAPGGKATALATTGAWVAAADVRPGRAALVAGNATRLGLPDGAVSVVAADARRPPFAGQRFDRVLVDAPCTGLGVLRRRADARWRVAPSDVRALAELQCELLDAAVRLVRPGGLLVYSVCTLTRAEGPAVDEWMAARQPHWRALPPLEPPWRSVGRGALLLPQDAGTDGMYLLRLVREDGR